MTSFESLKGNQIEKLFSEQKKVISRMISEQEWLDIEAKEMAIKRVLTFSKDIKKYFKLKFR